MEITINGQQAFLKKNTSFEYISENPLFTGSDSYTLSITFPLKELPAEHRYFRASASAGCGEEQSGVRLRHS